MSGAALPFHQDSAQVHSACNATDKLKELRCEQKWLPAENIFLSNEQFKMETNAYFEAIEFSRYRTGIKMWNDYYNKFITSKWK